MQGAQFTQNDLSNFTKKYSLFADIDNEVDGIYSKIKEKGIEINSLKDIERLDRFFLPAVKRTVKLIQETKQFDDFIKKEMVNITIINIFVRFCESYNLDPAQAIPYFGKEAERMFVGAQQSIDLS